MQHYLANLAVLNAKLHNLHWNVVGMNFMPIHQLTESLYDDAFEQFDAVAEHLKMKGLVPLSTLKDYLAASTIVEVPAKAFSALEVLQILKEDLGAMLQLSESIRSASDEAGDNVAVAFYDEQIGKYLKQLWFIDSMLQ